MKIIDLIRLLRKHIVLLVLAPAVLAALVIMLTRNPNWRYSSSTTLYTGIASGSSVEMDKSFNFFANNTSFDNLINVIKSRETQQEVAIRLLAQHLLLGKPDPKYISAKSYAELKRITPPYIYRLVAKKINPVEKTTDTLAENSTYNRLQALSDSFSFQNFADASNLHLFPPSIDQAAYERTVINLTNLMESSDTNFVYKLLNFPNAHYSFKDISSVKAQRIANSDLVQLDYETDDPGICQQTLALLTEVCIRNYKNIKENRSDAVIKYFEHQLKLAAERLRIAEDKLLEFNKANNIINYYEQSKAVAVVKEDLDVEYNNKKIKLAGIDAGIRRLEEKLNIQQQIQLKSTKILEKKGQLGDLNYRIAAAETMPESKDRQNLAQLKAQADDLKDEIKGAVSELYKYGYTTDGLPISSVLNDWINNVIEAENVKAGIGVLAERIKEFQKQYAIYAPAGANIKRIEREISVSEQEFLEILHGLNLAKLKMQDNELSSNIKAVDPPYYPLSPLSTKRKILVIVAALFGFMLVAGSILVMEYFDDTLKNTAKAAKLLKLPFMGVMPKLLLKSGCKNFPFITSRLLEITIQHIELYLRTAASGNNPKTLLFFSTQKQEGKTMLAGNLAQKLASRGKKVLLLNYKPTAQLTSGNNMDAAMAEPTALNSAGNQPQKKTSFINKLLGYEDNRIDNNSPMLANPADYLEKGHYLEYEILNNLDPVTGYIEILRQNAYDLAFEPDYVFIEIPALLYHAYPVNLVPSVDLPVLVCRSNRTWTEADQSALDVLMKLTTHQTHYMLNGVKLQVVESVLGELPKNRSLLRRMLKNFFRFQFHSQNHL